MIASDSNLFFGSRSGKIVQVDATTGAQVWSASLGVQQTGGGCGGPTNIIAIYGSPAASGNMVYTGSYVQQGNASLGKVFGFITGQSEPRWIYPRDGHLSGPVVGGLVVYQDKVYFGAADGSVYALDAADGHKIAQYQTGDKVWSTPAIDNGVVYIGSFDKKLYALDAETLQPTKWQSFATQGAIAATPQIVSGTIFVGSFDRNLYAINAETGEQKWVFPAGNWFWAQPIVSNDTVYAPSLDDRVYILDAVTGTEKAPVIVLDSPISSSPVLVGNKVIVAAESGTIYQIDTASNKESILNNRLGQKINAPLSVLGDKVYVHTDSDRLFAIDATTGSSQELAFTS